MKENYVANSVIVKWDEYDFILVDFAYVIPILIILLFSHYMDIKCFFSNDPKKKDGKWFCEKNLMGDE